VLAPPSLALLDPPAPPAAPPALVVPPALVEPFGLIVPPVLVVSPVLRVPAAPPVAPPWPPRLSQAASPKTMIPNAKPIFGLCMSPPATAIEDLKWSQFGQIDPSGLRQPQDVMGLAFDGAPNTR
jgi:hypothetical protein